MNILIGGLGSIAHKHIQAIRELKLSESLYALRSSEDADTYPGVQNIYSLNELAVKPDFVLICNPTRLHEQAILESLRFDCALFIEKPVLASLDHAAEIATQIRSKGIKTYVACNLRFHPALRFLKQYLDDRLPRINEVNIYCGSYLPDWRPGRDFRTIYSANADMGGGAHLDLIHELDYCTWLFGMPPDVRSIKRNVSSLEISAVDYAQFSLIYEGFAANVTLNYYRRDVKREIEIVTSSETLTVNLVKNTVTNTISGEVLFMQPFEMSQTYADQLRYFIDHIRKGMQPMNDFAEGVEVLKIAMHDQTN